MKIMIEFCLTITILVAVAMCFVNFNCIDFGTCSYVFREF